MQAVELLLVDDNDTDAELTLLALKRYNPSSQIIRFADGQATLEYLFQRETIHKAELRPNPKMILLDLKLVGMSGLDVLRSIKNNPLTHLIPVVIFSSSTQAEDIRDCYELGANSFISKPVQFEEFLETIKNLSYYWLLLNRIP